MAQFTLAGLIEKYSLGLIKLLYEKKMLRYSEFIKIHIKTNCI